MFNLETIKKEVYKNEKRKLYRRVFLLNIGIVLFLIASISNTTAKIGSQVALMRNEQNKTLKKLTSVTTERDSLKNVIVVNLDSLKKIENNLIRKTLSMSIDTNYNDVNLSDIYNLDSIVNDQFDIYKKIDEKITKNAILMGLSPNILPVSSADFIGISDKFGWRKHPIYKKWLFHEGIDITANKRTDVFATADGVVEKTYKSNVGYGNRIVIDHGNGYKTVYAHLSNIIVVKGQKIKKNDKIAYVGSTGLSTNNHLHYEVLLNNRSQDPMKYMDFSREYVAQK